MLSINKVMVTGRLTRDPETKYLPSGQALTNIGIAVSRNFKDKSGEWREDTMFIDVETWGKTAERCAETLKKGQPVYVEGRLKMDSWERDGQKQTKIRITAEIVKSFDAGSRGSQGSDSMGDSSDSEGYAESAPRAVSGAGRANSGATKSAAPTGAPSDGLQFEGGSTVQDDIPF